MNIAEKPHLNKTDVRRCFTFFKSDEYPNGAIKVTKSTKHLDEILKLKIKHAESIVNRYRTTISSYMSHHNCH
jgi:hypothetical protein